LAAPEFDRAIVTAIFANAERVVTVTFVIFVDADAGTCRMEGSAVAAS
jgi:hypothetical protein